MDANGMVEIGGLMFRFVRDGDQAPFDFHTQPPELLCWFCPALSMAEATALVRMGNGMSVTAENLRRLVLDNIEAVRSACATLPASEARSYTLRDTEPRIIRVAAQIVADATSGPIASPPQPAEVAALLRSIEWHAADEIDAPRCVVCGGQSPSDVGAGHTPDCALALMLARCEP